MNPQQQIHVEPTEQSAKLGTKKCNHVIIIIIFAVLAVSGFVFGGFELWQRMQEDNVAITSVDEGILSVDKESELGKELYEQTHDIVVSAGCRATVYPLYERIDVSRDNSYIVSYDDIPYEYKFKIIAKRTPKIINLWESGGETMVSKEEMEDVLYSIGLYGDIDYDIFGFSHSNSIDDEAQSVSLSDYEITRISDEAYLVSFERREDVIEQPACAQGRYSDHYEYVGLSNTIDNRLLNNGEEDTQKAMIVLERKTIDHLNESEGVKSTGYYGVLFELRQKENDKKYFWIGTYYLGNVI